MVYDLLPIENDVFRLVVCMYRAQQLSFYKLINIIEHVLVYCTVTVYCTVLHCYIYYCIDIKLEHKLEEAVTKNRFWMVSS